jgi:hypothetical protein
MPNTVVADTNLYYDLAEGRAKRADIVSGDEVLSCSPLSVIEIVSKMDEKNFVQRRNAVQAVLDHGANVIPDPQSFLTSNIFGDKLNHQPPDWVDVMKGVAGAGTLKDLDSGVIDSIERKVRTVSVDYMRQWREVIDEQWLQDLLDLMRDQFANFDEVHKAIKDGRKSTTPKLRKEKKKSFLEFINSPEWYIEQLRALYQRSLHYAEEPYAPDPGTMTPEKFLAILTKLLCYMGVYSEYVKSILTEGRLPALSDSGDMELMIYTVNDSHILATAESKWPEFAKRAGFEKRVRHVKHVKPA